MGCSQAGVWRAGEICRSSLGAVGVETAIEPWWPGGTNKAPAGGGGDRPDFHLMRGQHAESAMARPVRCVLEAPRRAASSAHCPWPMVHGPWSIVHSPFSTLHPPPDSPDQAGIRAPTG